jgi:hypothetical protein
MIIQKYQLHLICSKDELRPTMHYVKVTKNNTVATNGYVIGVVPTENIFDTDFIRQIPESGFLIHAEDFSKLIKGDFLTWKTSGAVISINSKKRPQLIEINTETKVGVYPNWEAVFPTGENVEITKIGVDFKIAFDLQKALDLDRCKLEFYGVNKGIKVTEAKTRKADKNKAYGLIMPCSLS